MIRAEIETLAAAAPEWKPTPVMVERLTRAEARRKLRSILKLGETFTRAGLDLCLELADFYDGRGPEALIDNEGKPLPMAFIASGLNVSTPRVHQWIHAGRAWRRCVNKVNADPMAEQITEAHLRPLTKLEPAQQPEALSGAFQIAREDHEIEQGRRKDEGRQATRLRLKQKHVNEAVRRILPADPGPSGHDPLRQLYHRICRLYDFATTIPGCPKAVIDPLRTARHNAESSNKC